MRKTLIAAVIAVTGWAGPALAEAEVVLKMHYFLPDQSFVPAEILKPWADAIEADSQGRIRIDRFPSMQLGGKPADLIDQMQDGVVDVVWTLPGYTPGRFPRTEVMELPFMVADAGTASRALWRIAETDMIPTEFKDIKLLGLWVHGPGVIHSAKPVARLEDMAGQKLRSPSRLTAQLLEKLGATPVGMPAPAVPEAVSKRVIDGALLPWEVTSSVRIAELVSHHTQFPTEGIYVSPLMLAMNKGVYDGLAPDLRAIIDAHSGEAFSAHAGAIQQGADAPMRDEAAARGNDIVTLPPEEAMRWLDAALPVIEAWVDGSAAQGFDGADLLARTRAGIDAAMAEAPAAAPAKP
ncbi:TRAP transporter substrate-binding protein [Paracoccus sp. p3-h83]|uniref:TRAP transporter substrate-binding protein n=1 Tax=Paracoccus sp. p3-h83 TaxID=3342805 RepID=UPI0035B78204